MAEKVMMIALSPTMEQGVIANWLVKEGDSVEEGTAICEVETDKATMEYEIDTAGTILKIVKNAGEGASVGETIAIIGAAGEDFSALLADSQGSGPQAPAPQAPPPQNVSQNVSQNASISNGLIKASPLARKLAKEKNLDLSQIKGSGPQGRIIKDDILNAKPSTQVDTKQSSTVIPKLEDKIIPVKGIRKVIAQRLSESKFSAPHYYVKNTINMTGIIDAREQLNKELRDKKVSFNAFLIKFAAEALKKYPVVNCSFQGDKIIQYGSIDIGLAVDINGLMTPVVRNAESKGIAQIEEELKGLIDKVKKGTISPAEYSGATFTISSLGSFGVEEFTSIINPPGSAILAVGATKKMPVVEGNNIVIRPMMKLTLSADHRSIDGKFAGMYLMELSKMMENPVRVLF